MREPEAVVRAEVHRRSRSQGRRARLKRGVERWNHDRRLCAERTRRVAFVTLTVASDDVEAAFGLARDFWRKVRQTWLGTRYFCWLEIQRRGAVHYHAIWLNPPHRRKANLLDWVDRHWRAGRTQVRFRQVSRGDDGLVDYVFKYANKIGNKAYQQNYDDVPRELRTFMSQRLEIPGPILDEHRDHERWRYDAERVRPDPDKPGFTIHDYPVMVLWADSTHYVPPRGRCSALDYRRPRMRAPPR